MLDALKRHERIALQFSGGKDSIACLLLLAEHLNKITVYHLDSGDTFPETREFVREVADSVPHFVTVPGRVKAVTAQYGIPSDIVPCGSSWAGQLAGDTDVPMLSRYECCFMSIQQPMHERMVADGVTLIIRGQKNSDAHTGPYQSGDVVSGVEFLYPLADWTDEDVFDYLHLNDVKLPRFYEEGLPSAPDCMTCSAWWDVALNDYMQRHHPEAQNVRERRIHTIVGGIAKQIAQHTGEHHGR